MTEELKACPFCGGKAVNNKLEGFGNLDYISCSKCGAGSSQYGEKSISEWNNRPREQELEARVKELHIQSTMRGGKIVELKQENTALRAELEDLRHINNVTNFEAHAANCKMYEEKLEELKKANEWQPQSSMPSYNFNEEKSNQEYLVQIEHDTTGEIKYVCGKMLEDGFYLSDGGELNCNWTPIKWKPIIPPEEESE